MSEVKKKSYKRTVVGSVLKNKDPNKPDYIKVKDNVTLKQGQILRLESKKYKLQSLDEAAKAGKLSGEVLEQRREQVNRIPEFVRFEVIAVEDVE